MVNEYTGLTILDTDFSYQRFRLGQTYGIITIITD
jgi:hypothetical protein